MHLWSIVAAYGFRRQGWNGIVSLALLKNRMKEESIEERSRYDRDDNTLC